MSAVGPSTARVEGTGQPSTSSSVRLVLRRVPLTCSWQLDAPLETALRQYDKEHLYHCLHSFLCDPIGANAHSRVVDLFPELHFLDLDFQAGAPEQPCALNLYFLARPEASACADALGLRLVRLAALRDIPVDTEAFLDLHPLLQLERVHAAATACVDAERGAQSPRPAGSGAGQAEEDERRKYDLDFRPRPDDTTPI